MPVLEDVMHMNPSTNDEMKNSSYIYRKSFFLKNEHTIVETASLSVETIEVLDDVVDRTLDMGASDIREHPIGTLTVEVQERVKRLEEYEEIYVMPKAIYKKLVEEYSHNLFDIPTEYMILLN
ncbi:hypothetical protein [Gracilibacillus sp. YIM 98692]|uniref:hypothetical protein n=1 Tax=Gracilibacillus sp. YIM 98692 TaxID=2663532 RepID=UPI0013D037E4|nr:hypothetical protein [Gracilibacillus sp. YIM 98692]